MTPEERLLRDMWMAELWPTVHGTTYEPKGRARSTCKACGKPVERRLGPGRPREYCPHCRPFRRAA